MKIENLETAAKFNERLKKLKELENVLVNWPNGCAVTVSYENRSASITDATLNGLLYGSIERMIDDIKKVVETL